jgi:hypothetical protein
MNEMKASELRREIRDADRFIASAHKQLRRLEMLRRQAEARLKAWEASRQRQT